MKYAKGFGIDKLSDHYLLKFYSPFRDTDDTLVYLITHDSLEAADAFPFRKEPGAARGRPMGGGWALDVESVDADRLKEILGASVVQAAPAAHSPSLLSAASAVSRCAHPRAG